MLKRSSAANFECAGEGTVDTLLTALLRERLVQELHDEIHENQEPHISRPRSLEAAVLLGNTTNARMMVKQLIADTAADTDTAVPKQRAVPHCLGLHMACQCPRQVPSDPISVALRITIGSCGVWGLLALIYSCQRIASPGQMRAR